MARDGHERRLRRDRVDRDVSARRLDLQLPAHRLEPDVTGRGANGHLAELAFHAKVGRPARELEVGSRRTDDATLEASTPGDLDRTPAEAIPLLDLHDVTTQAVVQRDLDLVDGVLAPSTDRDDLDGRAGLVGRRDQDATTRELDLEGDAPGRFEDVHGLVSSGHGRRRGGRESRSAACAGSGLDRSCRRAQRSRMEVRSRA